MSYAPWMFRHKMAERAYYDGEEEPCFRLDCEEEYDAQDTPRTAPRQKVQTSISEKHRRPTFYPRYMRSADPS